MLPSILLNKRFDIIKCFCFLCNNLFNRNSSHNNLRDNLNVFFVCFTMQLEDVQNAVELIENALKNVSDSLVERSACCRTH